MRQKLLRWQWIVLTVVATAALAATIAAKRGNSHASVKAAEPRARTAAAAGTVRVEVVRPTAGGIERQSIQPGSVMAFESAELFAKISGYLKSQTVDIGSRVQRGDVLVEIEAPEFLSASEQARAALDQSKAQVAQADARVVTAQADRDAAQAAVKQAEAEIDRAAAVRGFREKQYARIKSLYDLKSIDARMVDEKLDEMEAARASERSAEAGVVTAKAQVAAAAAKIDQAKADVLDAQAKVEVAQAALDKAQVFVAYTKIVSPYDGVVTKRNFFRGAFIRSPDQGGIVPLLAISRTDKMRVVVQVPDRDVPFTAVGNEATLNIDALPGAKFSGKVSRIADAEDQTTRTMRTEIDLPNPLNTLREGMYGRVTIRLNQGAKSWTIPSSALVGNVNEAGLGALFVNEKGVARLKTVRAGTDNGLLTEILEGLSADDDVIVGHRGALADGVPIQVVIAND